MTVAFLSTIRPCLVTKKFSIDSSHTTLGVQTGHIQGCLPSAQWGISQEPIIFIVAIATCIVRCRKKTQRCRGSRRHILGTFDQRPMARKAFVASAQEQQSHEVPNDAQIQSSLKLPPQCVRCMPPSEMCPSDMSLQGDWLPLFRSSAPYVNMFRHSIMIFHIPGHLLDRAAHREFETILKDIALCSLLGVRPVLVLSLEHNISARLQSEGRVVKRNASGHLLLEQDMLELVKQESGSVLVEIESIFRLMLGWVESPFSIYSSSQLFTAGPATSSFGPKCACCGKVQSVEADLIKRRLCDGDIVILTPLGMSATGDTLYVGSEDLATDVAVGLEAAKLVFFTRGQCIVDTRHNSVVSTLQLGDAQALIQHMRQGGIEGIVEDSYSHEILQYTESIVKALSKGTRRGHLIAPTQGALLQELYTADGSGTIVSHDLYEGLGFAKSADVSGILKLVGPLVQRGLLRRRSHYEVERACDKGEMFVWKRDDSVVACATLVHFEDAPGYAELGCFTVDTQCRGKGHGQVLLSYMEQVALTQGITTLFLLTTQTMQWFIEHGFREGSLVDLPLSRQSTYDTGRSSKIYVKRLDALPSDIHQIFGFVEVDTWDLR